MVWTLSRIALVAAAALGFAAHAKTPEQIFQQASRSVVVVRALDGAGNPVNQGGGVVTGRETVVTNCHVIEGGSALSVAIDTRTFDATLQLADQERDLCQLTVPQLAAPRAVPWTGRLRVGQRVYAIGAPEGLELTLSEGLISSLREFEGSQYIQTSAAISAGSSGGGLFDSEGRLIGITAFFLQDGQNLNFALPASWIVELSARARAGLAAAEREALARKWATRIAQAKGRSDWASVLTFAQQWVRTQPTHPVAWQELGDAYRNLNQPRRAISPYMQSVRLDPDRYESWSNLGAAYLALNQYDRAVETFQEALRVKPDDPYALYQSGVAYHFQNRVEKVREIHALLVKGDSRQAEEFARRYLKR